MVKRSVEVLMKKAVCTCIGLSDLSAKVSCSEALCEGAYDKGSAQAH